MFSLGAQIAKHKWKQVKSGQNTAYRLLTRRSLPPSNESDAIGWLMFFALESELFELAELFDELSFRQVTSELLEEIAYLGPVYVRELITFYNEVQASPYRNERRYRYLAACLRTMLQNPPAHGLPRDFAGYDKEAIDPELDDLELTLIKATSVARFFGGMLHYNGAEWRPRNTLLSACRPADLDDFPGAFAVKIDGFNFKRSVRDRHSEIVDFPRPERVVAISVGRREWLLRPSRGFGKARIAPSPPPSDVIAVPIDPAVRRAFNASLHKARSGNRSASLCFNALDRNNWPLLIGADPFPNTDVALDTVTFQRNWESILELIRPGDMLFSRDTKDRLSSIIALVDSGSWSHCVTYIGDGLVEETELNGTSVAPLETYGKCTYRLGLFRHLQANEMSAARQHAYKKWHLAYAQRSTGRPYDYLGAVRAGLNSMLRTNPKRGLTPNALIRCGTFIPVFLC